MDPGQAPILIADAVLDAALAADADGVRIEPATTTGSYAISITRQGELLARSTVDATIAGHAIARLGYVCRIDPSGLHSVTGRSLVRSCETERDLVLTIIPGAEPRAELLLVARSGKLEPRHELSVGDRVGHYWVVGALGAGGMGDVYEVEHEVLGTRAALKVLQHAALERDGKASEKFLHEARAAARIRSPHVVEVFDFGYLGERPYFVMELLSAACLEDVLTGGPLPHARALAIARQLARALATTHAHGVVHADVTPANISIDEDRVKLIDFGLARLVQRTLSGAPADFVSGTPHYLSPEQVQGYPASPASDQYAMGAVLFEMLSGHPPYPGASSEEVCLAHVHAPLPAVTSPHGAVPPRLAALITRCLAKHPEDRYPSMEAVEAALAAAAWGARLA